MAHCTTLLARAEHALVSNILQVHFIAVEISIVWRRSVDRQYQDILRLERTLRDLGGKLEILCQLTALFVINT